MINKVDEAHSHQQDPHILPPYSVVRIIKQVKDWSLMVKAFWNFQVLHVNQVCHVVKDDH